MSETDDGFNNNGFNKFEYFSERGYDPELFLDALDSAFPRILKFAASDFSKDEGREIMDGIQANSPWLHDGMVELTQKINKVRDSLQDNPETEAALEAMVAGWAVIGIVITEMEGLG